MFHTQGVILFFNSSDCLNKQQQILGAVVAEYEADKGDSTRNNLDEEGIFE